LAACGVASSRDTDRSALSAGVTDNPPKIIHGIHSADGPDAGGIQLSVDVIYKYRALSFRNGAASARCGQRRQTRTLQKRSSGNVHLMLK
jgi:hypothetical protein